MNNSKKLLSLAQLCRRQVTRSASGSTEVPARIQKLRQNQKLFDPYVNEETPVHLRAGFSDRALFGATTILIAGGFAMSLQTIWELVVKDL